MQSQVDNIVTTALPTQSTATTTETTTSATPTLRIKLVKPSPSRRVQWATNTVDNEFLNKKKSKCCCVYEKPRNWNESSSEDENEDKDCKNCRGHRKTDYNKSKDPHKHDSCQHSTHNHEKKQ